MDNWIKIEVFTATAGVEPLCASLLALGVTGFEVKDANDLEDFLQRKSGYWDYYDEELLKLRDAETSVTLYLADNDQGKESLAMLKSELTRLKSLDTENEWGRLEYAVSGVNEEDWAHNWKKYYHPVKIGRRFVVCPSWESYDPAPDEIVVKLDPGMAFGTGTHESTRLCMRLMETHMQKGAKVLDLGCGSGILAVSAVLLGAASAFGLDIDEDAVRVAGENAALNGVEGQCGFARGNLSDQIGGGYGLIFANIVADVIIEHARHIAGNLDDHGVLIVSGVIDTREDDVTRALTGAGLNIIDRLTDGGWVALACRVNI